MKTIRDFGEGDRFSVICKRCNRKFDVKKNWGGGIRNAQNERVNPAQCSCGSYQLEVF